MPLKRIRDLQDTSRLWQYIPLQYEDDTQYQVPQQTGIH
jgi:hypothetical protein